MNYKNKYRLSRIDFTKAKGRDVDALIPLLMEMQKRLEDENVKELSQIPKLRGGTTIVRTSRSGASSSISIVGNLIVRNADGSVIVNPATEIRFDEDDGFEVTSPSTGIARIDLDVTSQSYFRGGQQAITTSGTTISFSKPLNNPIVWATSCVDGGGSPTGVTFSSISSTGFVATPISNATLKWRAQPIEFPRKGTAIIETTATTVVLPLSYDDDQWDVHVLECLSLATWNPVGVEITAIADGAFEANAIERALLIYETCSFQ